jgi:hypothetical protein
MQCGTETGPQEQVFHGRTYVVRVTNRPTLADLFPEGKFPLLYHLVRLQPVRVVSFRRRSTPSRRPAGRRRRSRSSSRGSPAREDDDPDLDAALLARIRRALEAE